MKEWLKRLEPVLWGFATGLYLVALAVLTDRRCS